MASSRLFDKFGPNDNNKENYMELNYIQMMKKFMWMNGFWPGEALGENVPLLIRWHKVQIVLQNLIGFAGQIMYIVVFFDQIPFLDAGLLYITASLTFMIIVSRFFYK